MAKRYRVLIAIVILLQIIIYFLPYLPPVRNWLAHKLIDTVADAGYTVNYSDYPDGNAWTNIAFRNASLKGHGLDISAKKIRINYFLPSLLLKKISLRLNIDKAKGEINWQDLEFSDKAATIKLDFKTIKLTNSSLAIRDLPYTIPDLYLQDIEINTLADKYRLLALVNSVDGAAKLDAVIGLEPLQIRAKFKDLDLRTIRHWWGGLESGKASGNIIYNDGQLVGKANVENGELIFLNTDVKSINGEVKLNYPDVFLNLNGKTIAGNIKANGKVAIAEQQWSGDIEGDFPLKDAAIWIAKDRINIDLSNWDLLGNVNTKARVYGWQAVNVVGRAKTAGSLQGRDIKELKAVYSYASFEGIRVSIFGNIADGDIEAELNPIENGLEFDLRAKNVVWLEDSNTKIDFYFDTANRANTSLVVNTNIKRAGRDINIFADTVLDNNVWRAELKASDDLAETMTGTLTYQNKIDAQLKLKDLKLPYFADDALAEVVLSGQLGDLLMEVDVYRDAELNFKQERLSIIEDFAGHINSTISYDSFEAVTAKLGPLSLAGRADMSFQNAVFNFELQPSQIRGLAEGELAAKRGLLLIEKGKYDLSAAIVADLKADEIAASFGGFASFDNNTANRFRFLSETVKLSFADAIWQFDLDKQAASIYNTDVFVSGQAELASLEDFNLDLFINSELADLALKGTEEDLNFILNAQNTRFVGLANVLEKSFLASAKLADLDLNIDGVFGADTVQARANLHNSQDELILLVNGPADINKLKFDLSGQINVHAALKLAQQYSFLEGLDLRAAEGILKPKISYQNSIASGNIAFDGSYLNYPLKLDSIISKNQELNYSGQSTIQGQSIALSGQAYPEQSLLATNDLGRIEVFRDDFAKFIVSGQGTSPELIFSDWKISQQDWQLSGDLQELDLKLGESKLKFNILDDSWQAFAEINQKARQSNQELQLLANFNSSKENFDGQILGAIFYKNNTSLEIPVSGSLASLDFAKKLSAKDLLALADFDFELLGDLELVGNLKPKTQEYKINGFWLTGNERIELELAGVAAEWQARAYSPNIQASYQAGNLNLDLNNFDPNKFISTYPSNYKLRGQMSYDNELGWAGSFNTANSLNFNQTIIPLNLTAIGADKKIELTGQAIIQNKDIALSGQIYPKIDIKASNELGEIFLKRELGEFSLSGGGEIAQIKSQGWLSKTHTWSLTGDLQDIHIALGKSEFDFSWQDSNWQLAGTLNEKIFQNDKEIALWADMSLSKEKPNGEILGSLSYTENDNYLELPISGSLELINFSAKKSAKELLQLVGFDFELLGDVEVSGSLNPKTQVYNLTGFLLTGDERIEMELTGLANDYSARAYSPNIKASIKQNLIQLELIDFRANSLLSSFDYDLANFNSDALLNGLLSFDLSNKYWQGEVLASSNKPLKSQLSLVAQAEKLILSGNLSQSGINLNYSGELWPKLNIDLSSKLAGYGQLSGLLNGSFSQLLATGTILTNEILLEDKIKAKLAAQSFTWLFKPLEDNYFEVFSDLASLSLVGKNLAASFELPITIENEEHLLSAELSGSIYKPIVQAYVEGPVVSGPINYQEQALNSNLSLDPSYWLENLGKQLAVEVSAVKEGEETRIKVLANIAGKEISLDTLVDGGLNNNSGTASIVFANQEIPISFDTSLGRLELDGKLEDFDLASLNIFAPVGISGLINGELFYNEDSGFNFAINTEGQLREQSFEFEAEYKEKSLFINGQAANRNFELQDMGAGQFHLSSKSNSQTSLDLDINLSYQKIFKLTANGQVNNEDLLLTADFNPKDYKGAWQLSLASINWRGQIEKILDVWQLISNLEDSKGYFNNTPIANSLKLSLIDNQIFLDSLDLLTSYQEQVIKLQASGLVWPKLTLQGLVNIDNYDFVLSAQGSNNLFDLKLQYEQLVLATKINQQLEIKQASLVGKAEHEFIDILADISSDIFWDSETGFSGLANIKASYNDYKANFELLGNSNLSFNGQILNKGLVADILFNIAQNPFDDINGLISARADTSLISYDDLDLDLLAELDISGSIFRPILNGELKSKKLNLSGQFNYDKIANFNLTNDNLSIKGGFDNLGVDLDIVANDYDLSRYIGFLKEPRLGASLNLKKAWIEPVLIRTNSLFLNLPNSQINAELNINGHKKLSLDNNIDLQDLKISSLPLLGKLTGPLELDFSNNDLAETQIRGKLNISGLDYLEDALLLGDIELSGKLSSPTILLNLNAQGSATGSLKAVYQPNLGFYSLTSNVNFADYKSDFSLSLDKAGFAASGQMAFKDYGLFLSEDRNAQKIILNGQGRLENWQGYLDFKNESLALGGQLSAITSSLSGAVTMQGSWAAESDYWLKGDLQDINVFGVELGSANLHLSQGDNKLSLIGEKIRASAFLSKRFSYNIEYLAASLNDSYFATLQGDGNLGSSEFLLELNGSYAEQEFSLPLNLSYSDKLFKIKTDADIFDGHINLDAKADLDSGWQGSLSLNSLTLTESEISYQANILGNIIDPIITGDLNFSRNQALLTGALQISRLEILLDQALSYPQLDQELGIEGKLWPKLDVNISSGDSSLRVLDIDNKLSAQGNIDFKLAFTKIAIKASKDFVDINVAFPDIKDLTFATSLAPSSLESFLLNIKNEGLSFEANNAASGSIELAIKDRLSVTIKDFIYQSPYGEFKLSGQLGEAKIWQGKLVASLERQDYLNWLPEIKTLDFSLIGADDYSIIVNSGDLTFDINMDENFAATIKAKTSRNQLITDLRFDRYSGFSGLFGFGYFLVHKQEASESRLSADFHISKGEIIGLGELSVSGQKLSFSQAWGLENILPKFLNPISSNKKELDLRIDKIALEDLPIFTNKPLYLKAPISGVLRLNQGQVIASFQSPNLTALDNKLPLKIDMIGNLNKLELTGNIAKTTISGALYPDDIDLLFRLEHFPIEALAESIVGNTNVNSSVTGILRFQSSFNDLKNADIRFASEQIVLEQNGVESVGNLSFSYQDQELDIPKAEFFGAGHWFASGKISSNELSLKMDAQDANFNAFIALIPQLSIFDVGATGSLSISSSGSLIEPNLQFDSSALNITVANTEYLLSNAHLELIKDKLAAQGKLTALSPISGDLDLSAAGKIKLLPWQVENFRLDFSSPSTQLTIGELRNFSGVISRNTNSAWLIDAKGRLTNEIKLSGSLNPFDVNLNAEKINIVAPRYFVANALLDANININYNKNIFISGDIFAHKADLIISGREKRPKQEPSRALEHIFFNDLKISAPQKIFLNEPVGSAEMSLNTILTGAAAKPKLRGRADTLRGDFRFSGRSFIIDSAAAIFQQARGIYPQIDIRAHSSISKRGILRGVEDRLSIIEPRSDTVEIVLKLIGSVEASNNSNAAFKLDLQPSLSSNVIIQDLSFNNSRKLNDSELYSLLTLAKIELPSIISDTGGVAETALQGALDTAIDVLILSALQKELGNALGVDIFEIRTTPFSALFEGQEDFGVSLRIGAYLENDLFASYSFTSQGFSSEFSLSHEFSLRYDLAPLSLDLRGRLNFLENDFYTPVPEFALDLTYAFSELSSIELGLDISNSSQTVNFGVGFRW